LSKGILELQKKKHSYCVDVFREIQQYLANFHKLKSKSTHVINKKQEKIHLSTLVIHTHTHTHTHTLKLENL
jgi:hypothetical protein